MRDLQILNPQILTNITVCLYPIPDNRIIDFGLFATRFLVQHGGESDEGFDLGL